MKTMKINIASILLILLCIWGCEKDQFISDNVDGTRSYEAKKGGGGKPGEGTEGITIQDLGTLGGTWSEATDVNIVDGNLHVVGTSETANGYNHAFLWTATEGMIDLGVLDNSVPRSGASAVNSTGVILGYSFEGDGSGTAVKWVNQNLIPLGGYAGKSINDRGDIAGYYYHVHPEDILSVRHAFVSWEDGSSTDLGTLGDEGVKSSAWGINYDVDGVTIVGESELTVGDDHVHAFRWDQVSGMIDLGTAGGVHSFAVAVNGDGKIVGYSLPFRAILWENDQYTILPTLGGTESWAWDVSEAGHIVGASKTGSRRKGFVAFFLHGDSNQIFNLGTLGGKRSDAVAVVDDLASNRVIAVGSGEVKNSQTKHAVVWIVDLDVI